MAKLIALLLSIHLSLTQWLLFILTSISGILVVAFKLQGSALHKAQVELLLMRWQMSDNSDQLKVDNAKISFQKALKEYDDANHSS